MNTILAVSTALCAGFVMLLSSTAQAQNLFVTGGANGPNNPCIAEFVPDGTSSIFTTNVHYGVGLAFDSAGNLFEADSGSGNIYEFTPGGARSTFASGAGHPFGLGALAFDSTGNLFLADEWDGNIYKFTPGGVQSIFASGLPAPAGLAFQGVIVPVPEPSILGLLVVGASALLVRQRKMRYQPPCARLASF